MKDDNTTNSHYITYTFLFEGWENVLFELGSERDISLLLLMMAGGLGVWGRGRGSKPVRKQGTKWAKAAYFPAHGYQGRVRS